MAARWRWAVGLVALAALVAGGWWFLVRQNEHATESPAAPMPATNAPPEPSSLRNQPFPGPDPSLPEDAQRAVTVAATLAQAGAETKVAQVKLTTYEAVMCGRQSNYDHTPRMVWTVWLQGPFRFMAHPFPGGITPTPEPDSILSVLDAESFVSQQSFAPWPLPRTMLGLDCPPE